MDILSLLLGPERLPLRRLHKPRHLAQFLDGRPRRRRGHQHAAGETGRRGRERDITGPSRPPGKRDAAPRHHVHITLVVARLKFSGC